MIDLKTVAHELAQARQARIEAQLAGCEVEELADNLRQANAADLRRQHARHPTLPRLFVFAP
jgi:hypothetical protein